MDNLYSMLKAIFMGGQQILPPSNPSATDGKIIQNDLSTQTLDLNAIYNVVSIALKNDLEQYTKKFANIKEEISTQREQLDSCLDNINKKIQQYKNMENFQKVLEEKYLTYDSLSNSINTYKFILKLFSIPLIIVIIMLSGLYIHLFFSNDFHTFFEYIKNIITYVSVGVVISLAVALIDSFYLYKKIREIKGELNHLQTIVWTMQNTHQQQ